MSDVVKVKFPENDIAEICLEDRNHHNTFSPALIQGLKKTFSELPSNIKVAVIHGYENYFCCGGTEEELLQLHEGKISLVDLDFYRILLDCEIPTIAAMQGHAIGGGLVFGSYADLMVLAEEAIYTANFMKYGFTPGLGATYILPKKFGDTLANEMMFTAKNYHGAQLKERNIQLPVVKKQDVLLHALELAKELADKPLVSLKLLKQSRVSIIKKELISSIDQELKMHQISFKLPEVRERIIKLFKR